MEDLDRHELDHQRPVTSGVPTQLSLTATTTTPSAGAADNLTITAKDAGGNIATSYAGSHSLTFGGAGTIGTNNPTVSSSAGTATNFGTATAISFTSGVATVSGANNGVMRLYKAETASVTVTDGTISNGGGVSVTVSPTTATRVSLAAATTTPTAAAADNLTTTALDTYGNTATSYTGAHNQQGTVSSPCLFTCTVTGLGNVHTITANVSVTDSSGNTVSNLGLGHTVSLAVSGGGTATPSPLTINASGAANSTLQFSFLSTNGNYTSTITAATLTGTAYTSATLTAIH